MKQAMLLHGTGGNGSDYFWFADTKNFLEDRGYRVWWPDLPNADSPDLETSYGYVHRHRPNLDADSIVIGHSSACPLILSILQRENLHIKQAVLVAGYYTAIDDVVSDKMIEKVDYDWPKIRHAADEIILINSDNDPWGCDAAQAKPVAEKLGARFILAAGQGHMGSENFHQPYREHLLVKQLLNV